MSALARSDADMSVTVLLNGGKSPRLAREPVERTLRPERTDAVSAALSSPFDRTVEFLGLSVLPLPGILDRRERKDRDDSFVSDRLKEGSDCRPGSPPAETEPLGVEVPSLEG